MRRKCLSAELKSKNVNDALVLCVDRSYDPIKEEECPAGVLERLCREFEHVPNVHTSIFPAPGYKRKLGAIIKVGEDNFEYRVSAQCKTAEVSLGAVGILIAFPGLSNHYFSAILFAHREMYGHICLKGDLRAGNWTFCRLVRTRARFLSNLFNSSYHSAKQADDVFHLRNYNGP